MICKHFNLSYIGVRDDIDLYEYWQLLATAYKAEELEDYNMASLVAIGVNDPKRLKRWKFSDPDLSGKVKGNPGETMARMAQLLSGGDMTPNGSAIERARATGRRIIYVVAENQYIDEQGNPTERRKGEDIVLQLPQTSQVIN